MTLDSRDSAPPRIQPSVAVGIAAWLAYTAVTCAIQASSGIAYADWFRTAAGAWRTGVLSLAAGSILLVVFVTVARWRLLWRDPLRLGTNGLMKMAMLLWWAAIAARLIGVRWGDVPPGLLLAVALSGVLVGFAEETLFRGIFLRCLREGGRSEAAAALWTAVCFGLFHLPNVFMGMGPIGVVQVVLAALSGSLLYVFRRHYGTIWPAMVAHGAWDISTFLAVGYASPWLAQAALPMQGVFVIMGIGVLASIARNDRRTIVIPGAGA